MNAKILDPCCGSRMFHFDRQNENVVFGDIRKKAIFYVMVVRLKWHQILKWIFVICRLKMANLI